MKPYAPVIPKIGYAKGNRPQISATCHKINEQGFQFHATQHIFHSCLFFIALPNTTIARTLATHGDLSATVDDNYNCSSSVILQIHAPSQSYFKGNLAEIEKLVVTSRELLEKNCSLLKKIRVWGDVNGLEVFRGSVKKRRQGWVMRGAVDHGALNRLAANQSSTPQPVQQTAAPEPVKPDVLPNISKKDFSIIPDYFTDPIPSKTSWLDRKGIGPGEKLKPDAVVTLASGPEDKKISLDIIKLTDRGPCIGMLHEKERLYDGYVIHFEAESVQKKCTDYVSHAFLNPSPWSPGTTFYLNLYDGPVYRGQVEINLKMVGKRTNLPDSSKKKLRQIYDEIQKKWPRFTGQKKCWIS